ncbi:ABC transporter ATP-binding protein [Bacillus tianshenii]|nr:ABC transporter ATP-binding protein [Bacillus tianshenii]
MIQLQNITKSFRSGTTRDVVLDDVSLTIAQGEYLAIMGSSGSGKSTLMNIIGTLEKPEQGEYLFYDAKVHKMWDKKRAIFRNENIGFVFQNFHLIPNLSVYQNVLLSLTYSRKMMRSKKKRVLRALEDVGLTEKRKQKPHQLSGGQKQRVAIARALVNEPSIILADEPTGSLDEQTSEKILTIFDRLHKKGVTIVMITHDPDVAKRADRIVYLRNGQLKEYAHENLQSI